MGRTLTRRELMASAALAPAARAAGRPNFVFVLMDDARADELHATGHPFARTPHIDRIAAEGVTFRNAFVTTPLCSPSRASYLTGMYAHAHGIVDNTDRSAQSRQLVTFPYLLHRAGYESAFIGKWHMGVDDAPRPGFDRWVSFKGQGTYHNPELNVDGKPLKASGYTTDILTDYSVEFLKRRHERPFLLYLAHKAIHPELTQYADGSVSDPGGGLFLPAERHQALYAGARFPRRPNAAAGPRGKPALERATPGLPPLGPATGTDDETIRNRARMMQAVDEGVGKMLAALEDSGQLDNTVFVFTSDEGYFFGEHGLSYERRLAYEESIRIPLLVRYPRLAPKGRVADLPALNIDIASTLLDLAGVAGAPPMHGRSLVPLLRGERPAWRRSFLVEYCSDKVFPRVRNMGYQCVRTDRWKYIHYTELSGMDELYDLAADPYEMRNVIGSPAARTALEAARRELADLLRATAP